MTIVFLDDDPNRQKVFGTACSGAVIYTTTAQQTIEAIISLPEIDVLFLDHDLGGEVYVDSSREDTGAEVARWIKDYKPVIHNIVIHTYNSAGAKTMLHLLRDYNVSYMPFASDRFKETVNKL